MKQDILYRRDVEELVDTFYEKVKKDEVIGFFFTDVVTVHWPSHLPVMYSFWENVIFQTGGYAGNPMVIHSAIHKKSPMLPEHFKRWTVLFTATVDELFEGNNAELAKQRAVSIATVMQIKIHNESPFSQSDAVY